jgi:4-amino-4-deoxy-L-arabinose transferase-like glycosyltransferase
MNAYDRARSLISIFVVALILRLAFVFIIQDGFYFYDSVAYSAAAAELLQTGEFAPAYTRNPVYPVFLAGVYGLFGQSILAVRIVESVLGAGLAVLIAVLAGRIAGTVVGTLSGLLWSLYPMAVFVAGLVYPETLVTTLLLCGVLCLVTQAGPDLGPARILVSGILFGLAALTKPVVLATVAAAVLWLLYWKPARRFSVALAFLIGAAIPLAPWTARNYVVHGGLVAVEPRLLSNLPWVGDIPEAVAGTTAPTKAEAILRHPAEFAAHFAGEFLHFWELYPQRVQMDEPEYRQHMHERDGRVVRETVIGTKWTKLVSLLSVGPMFILAVIGASALWAQRAQRQALSLLLLTILSFAVGYSFFYAKTRYRFPVEPYIMVLSAAGLHRLWRAWNVRSFTPPP